VLIPLLDVLQSVPVLGYLSFTVVFFVSLFPSTSLGPELAAIFAIFTAQAWNMAFSFYQSLITIPTDLDEASRGFRFFGLATLSAPRRSHSPCLADLEHDDVDVRRLVLVVASEAISVGNIQIVLPGIGSYVALAIQQRDLAGVGWAIVAMTITILIYDQLLFRPLVVWADKFRFEQTAALAVPRSWVLDLFRGASFLGLLGEPIGRAVQAAGRTRRALPRKPHWLRVFAPPRTSGEIRVRA
jgi:NitT/TauT family transport system permease protein